MRLIPYSWQVAYRKKVDGGLLRDSVSPFTLIPNSKDYVAADPFIFEYENEVYIFAELIDRGSGKGSIGYSKWNGNTFSKWKRIISESWHLSYPNVFEYEGNIYIMPEAHSSGELYLYRAVDFPEKWIKERVLLRNIAANDSTILHV